MNRHITEIHDEEGQPPHVHGGAGDDSRGVPEAELHFEDLEESEKRVDEAVAADEVLPDVPAPSSPAVQRYADGQEVPGMEVDVVHGDVVDVSSPCADRQVENSPCAVRRVERGGAVKPSLCDDTCGDL